MREAFRQDLDQLAEQLTDLAELAKQAMTDATTALLDTDKDPVNQVEDAVDKIRIRHHELDDLVVSVIARQQPVATDLRVLVAGLRISADMERMSELALHVAEIVHRRAPHPVVPPELRETVIGMVNAAKHIIAKARMVIASRDAAPRCRDRDGHHPDRPLLRTLCRPRGVDRTACGVACNRSSAGKDAHPRSLLKSTYSRRPDRCGRQTGGSHSRSFSSPADVRCRGGDCAAGGGDHARHTGAVAERGTPCRERHLTGSSCHTSKGHASPSRKGHNDHRRPGRWDLLDTAARSHGRRQRHTRPQWRKRS